VQSTDSLFTIENVLGSSFDDRLLGDSAQIDNGLDRTSGIERRLP
jgi:hypothetical protein